MHFYLLPKVTPALVTFVEHLDSQALDPNRFFLLATGIDLEKFIDRIVHQEATPVAN